MESAAGHRHETHQLQRLFAEFVAFRFQFDRFADGGFDFGIGGAATQQGRSSKRSSWPSTCKGAIDRQAYAVAGGAEVLRNRRDEADVELAVRAAQITCRTGAERA